MFNFPCRWVSIENIKKTQYCVDNLKTKSSYRFRVFAVNEVGVSEASESTEYVRVERTTDRRPPVVERPLEDTFGAPGEDLELTCIFGGHPVPKITWYRNNEQLKTARATYINRVATLSITVSTNTEGRYRCVAVNELGEAETSCLLELRLKPSVEVEEEQRDQRLAVGETWRVEALVGGQPRPTVDWYRDGVRLTAAPGLDVVTGDTSSVITIASLQRSHSGRYTVEAVNKAGSASADVNLKVVGEFPFSVCAILYIYKNIHNEKYSLQ